MLKVCVIGLGNIGNLHSTIYSEDELCTLAGVCDIIPQRAEATGRRLGVPYFTDALEMLGKTKPDICSVATGGYEYSSDHYLATMQALEAGCNVLCEKPISNMIEHGQEMVDKAAEKGLCFALDLNHRFTPAALQAKKWQNEGRIGDLLFINMSLWIGKFMELDSKYFHLKALNPHSIDIMRYFCGDIEEVHCFAAMAPGRNIYSTASFNMRFTNGAVGHLTSSYDIQRGHPMERCEVAGTKGRFIIDDMWRESTLYPAGDYVKSVYTNPVFGGYRDFEDTFRARINAFVRQIAAGDSPDQIDGSGLSGLKAQKVIHAAIESIETGLPVKVKP